MDPLNLQFTDKVLKLLPKCQEFFNCRELCFDHLKPAVHAIETVYDLDKTTIDVLTKVAEVQSNILTESSNVPLCNSLPWHG